jgi:hypothetical protein
MTDRSDFTDEEWELLREGPPSAGMAVVMADRGGLMRESYSMAKAYVEARKQPGHSALLDEIVESKPELDHTRHHSKQEVIDAGLERLRNAIALLERKASADEVEEYRSFCVSVAEHVANAAKEGFLGLTGERVSEEEQSAVERVKEAVGAAA